MSTTSYNLGTVSSTSTDSPEKQINAVIARTQAALNELNTAVSSDNSNSALLRYQVPIDTDVQKGHLVYWMAGTTTSATATDGKYAKALAELSGDSGANGASVETAKSHVEGLIIEANHDGNTHTGTLLVCGSWTDQAAMTTCLGGSDAVQGVYYLSPTVAGTAVLAAATYGKLQQGLLAYHGGGSFTLNLFYQANDHHYHGSDWLTSSNWKSADSTHSKPTAWTNGMWYDGSTSSQFKTAGPLTSDITTVFHNGSIQKLELTSTASFGIDDDGVLWYNGSTAPSGNCAMFNHFPFAYGSPVVRSVKTAGALLSTENNNGIVTISQSEYTLGTSNYSSTAIRLLNDGVYYTTPVVSNLIAGPGISAYSDTDGQVTVSTSNLIGTPLDAYGMTHNGTVVTSNGIYQYITFQRNRSASIVISMPVTGVSSTTTLKATCWGELEGTPGATFNVESNFIPLPSSGASSYSTSSASTQTLTFSGGTASSSGSRYIEYAETSSGPQFTGNGFLVAGVTINNPPSTADVRLLRLGFKLNVVNSSTSASVTTENMQYVVNEQSPATTNPPVLLKAVRMTSDGLKICTAADSTHYNTCIGVASHRNGSLVAYVTAGAFTDTGFSFGTTSVGAALYLGSDGSPTTTAPSSGYIQRIGTVLGANTMLVNIQGAVTISNS